MLYSIVNPSDPYTIEAPSLDVAAMTAVLLGQGNYVFEPIGSIPIRLADGVNDGRIPAFSFGDGDEWCKKQFGETLMEMSNRVMDTKLGEVADCLDSVLYGDAEDRTEFMEAAKGLDRDKFLMFRMARQDTKRSSMNDIGERAYRMAAKLRQSIADGIKTLQ